MVLSVTAALGDFVADLSYDSRDCCRRIGRKQLPYVTQCGREGVNLGKTSVISDPIPGNAGWFIS